MKVLLLGAQGAIGGVLKNEFEGAGAKLICVHRTASAHEISFKRLVDSMDPDDFDLIVDAASLSLDDALRMALWVGKSNTPVFHFSSVRVGAGDVYGECKRQIASLYRNRLKIACIFNGDLFSEGSSLVGYWSFVREYFNWRYFSFRTLRVLDLSTLVPFFEDCLKSGGKEFDCKSLERQMVELHSFRVPRFVILFLTKLRFNFIGRYFRISVVL